MEVLLYFLGKANALLCDSGGKCGMSRDLLRVA